MGLTAISSLTQLNGTNANWMSGLEGMTGQAKAIAGGDMSGVYNGYIPGVGKSSGSTDYIKQIIASLVGGATSPDIGLAFQDAHYGMSQEQKDHQLSLLG